MARSLNIAVASYLALTSIYMIYTFFDTFYQPSHALHKRDNHLASVNTPSVVNLSDNTKLRIMSWNLRNAKKSGSATPSTKALSEEDAAKDYWANYQEVPWSLRLNELAEQVNFYAPDIFAVEEALEKQVNTLADHLAGYKWVGVGRDDGKKGGEFEAVFYKESVVSVKNWTTFWLSDSPEKVSKYKDAGSTRTATVVQFTSLLTGLPFTFINTHFDDRSDEARQYGASLIKQRAAYEYEHNGGPVFLVGDFNSKSEGKSSGAYKILTGQTKALDIDKDFAKTYKSSIADKFTFTDFYEAVDSTKRLGHYSTFTGFYKIDSDKGYGRIDFHLGGSVQGAKGNGWNITRTMVVDNFPDVKYHLSDHRAVISDLTISKLS